VLESYERQMETNKAKREELKEALKAIPEWNSARESIESDKERYDGYYKQAKSNYDKAVKTKERGFAVLEKYWVDSIEKAKDLIKSLQEELAKLVDEKELFTGIWVMEESERV
jgi:DNA repair exonuclease SbcCD ATPase subunit